MMDSSRGKRKIKIPERNANTNTPGGTKSSKETPPKVGESFHEESEGATAFDSQSGPSGEKEDETKQEERQQYNRESNSRKVTLGFLKPEIICKNNGCNVKIEWKAPASTPKGYLVIWSCGGREEKEIVQGNSWMKNNLVPGSMYRATVAILGDNDKVLSNFSDPQYFFAVPMPPKNVQLLLCEASPTDSAIIRFDDDQTPQIFYTVTIKDLTEENQRDSITVENRTYHVIKELKEGHSYIAQVVANIADGEHGVLQSRETLSNEITMYPGEIKIKHEQQHEKHMLLWDKTSTNTLYEVTWESKDAQREMATTDLSPFIFADLKPGQTYTAKVSAINKAGRGKPSCAVVFETAPIPPQNIAVTHQKSSPHTAIAVTFQDKDIERKSYTISVCSLTGQEENEERVKQGKRFACIDKLTPGEKYEVSITSNMGDLQSERIYYPDLVQMYPEAVTDLHASIVNGRLIVQWKPVSITPNHYIVMAKIDDREVVRETTTKTKHVFTQLQPSSIYTVAVLAENDAGCGEECESQEMITDPSPPTKVMVTNNSSSPETSLIVKYDDPEPVYKTYEITAFASSTGKKVEAESHEKLVVLRQLTPGESYQIHVVAKYEHGNMTARSIPCYFN